MDQDETEDEDEKTSSYFLSDARANLSESDYDLLMDMAMQMNEVRATEVSTDAAFKSNCAMVLHFCHMMKLTNHPVFKYLEQLASSIYLQKKVLQMNSAYVSPREHIAIGGGKFYYIPIKKVLLNRVDQELAKKVLKESSSNSSRYVKEMGSMNKLRLILYGDDFAVVNPLNPKQRNQKIFSLYLDFDNAVTSRARDFPALILSNRRTIKMSDSINSILDPLIDDIVKIQVMFLFY